MSHNDRQPGKAPPVSQCHLPSAAPSVSPSWATHTLQAAVGTAVFLVSGGRDHLNFHPVGGPHLTSSCEEGRGLRQQ
jgi:hypothetical protein